MKIGIDARLYSQTGVGRYIKNLLHELPLIDQDNQYIVYLRSEEYDLFVPPTGKWEKRRADIRWHSIKEQFEFPKLLEKDQLDLAHFPYFNVPILYRYPYVLTIHDLIIDHFDTGRASTLPYPIYKIKRMGYKAAVTLGIKKASAITTISVTTKNEIMDHYNVQPDKITVTYDALDEQFKQLVLRSKQTPMYAFPYILYVGNAYPHKNLERLLLAFSQISSEQDIKLVLAGNDSFFYPRIQEYAKKIGIEDKTLFFGMANDEQLLKLYTGCKYLVFPSLMEGFGLPTFEALFCDKLAVISDIPVFREIWKDDVLYVDPTNVESISSGLCKALSISGNEYNRRVKLAKKHIGTYSWETAAKQTLEVYTKVLEGVRR